MNAVAPTVEISAVMPAYNEEANLEQSVGRMATALQTFARGFEIIVVDDGSQDGTAAVPGDWVLIHVGFALSKVDEEEAHATMDLLQRMGSEYEQELEELKASVIE